MLPGSTAENKTNTAPHLYCSHSSWGDTDNPQIKISDCGRIFTRVRSISDRVANGFLEKDQALELEARDT